MSIRALIRETTRSAAPQAGEVLEVGSGRASLRYGGRIIQARVRPGTMPAPGDMVTLARVSGWLYVDGIVGRNIRKEMKEVWIDG